MVKSTFPILIVLLLCQVMSAQQRVFLIGTELVVSEYGGLSLSPLGDFYGDDVSLLEPAIQDAFSRLEHDRMRIDAKKVASFGFAGAENSCDDAANHLISTIKSNQSLPEGGDIFKIGTLGWKTNASNRVSQSAQFLLESNDGFTVTNPGNVVGHIKWLNNTREFLENQPDHFKLDRLDPDSYQHSLSLIQLPNGHFYTIDTWNSGGTSILMQRVYPIDDDGVFFSDDPNETDINNSDFRIHRAESRKCTILKNCDEEQEPDDVSPSHPTSEPVDIEVLTSADPNDKLGLNGVKLERYILPGLQMNYIIRFENMPDATAPAQEVLIRDTLDTRYLDLSTFQLGDITFSEQTVEVPQGQRTFFTRIPLEDDRFDLLIDVNLVVETGIVTWRFTTIDPEINDLPFDPLDGFLPPNVNAPEGEGSVSFIVMAFEDIPDNTVIRNEARIYFDLNEPIDTPPWVNSIDTGLPSSQINGLAPQQGSSAFDVTWDGSDAASGVSSFDIYVAENDGPYTIWHRNVTYIGARFSGHPDSTYSFFSIAYDAVGNMEPLKTVPDAVTTITVNIDDDLADLPTRFDLYQNYPNPFNPSTNIRYALPEAASVSLIVYDILGRRVATLVNEEKVAGWHEVTWNTRGMASGTYFYRITAGNFTSTRKMMLLK